MGRTSFFFDYNLIEQPGTTPGVDNSRGYGRFNILGGSVDLVNPENFDGVLAVTSNAIDSGTTLYAPTTLHSEDIVATPRDVRPDMGAWELPGQSPAAETASPVYNDIKTLFVDDFEDGHYNDIDPWLDAPATQGMSWYRPAGYDGYKYFVRYDSSFLSRNALHMPSGILSGREAWLLSEQGSDWADYTFEFNCHNAYLGSGGGVCVLAADEDNCYYLDIAAGRLIRILDGVETLLVAEQAIRMPNSGQRTFKIDVDVLPTGAKITVDADNDGSVDLTFTDTDPTAASVLTTGGVGFHCDNIDVWHVLRFDDIRVEIVTTPAGGPIGRHVFYNNSSFDGNDPAANTSDDNAIATDKQALLPGGSATFANFTSYDKGINGIIVDISALPGSVSASDFEFKIGNDSVPATWPTAPTPISVTTRTGEGAGGSDRVTIIFADGDITGKWLQVKVLANPNTGLASDDVFYFGNAIGDTGNSTTDAIVDTTDEIAARNNSRNFMRPASIDYPYDHNRDGKVDATDEIISRNNNTDFTNDLELITTQ